MHITGEDQIHDLDDEDDTKGYDVRMRYTCDDANRADQNNGNTRAQQSLRWATVPEQSRSKKWWGCCAPFRGSPSNTMSPGPSPTSVPSGILIHLTVWHNTPTLHADRQAGHRSDTSKGEPLHRRSPKNTTITESTGNDDH